MRRYLIGVYGGSLRVRQAGGGENLLNPCVLAAAVLVDARGGGTGLRLAVLAAVGAKAG